MDPAVRVLEVHDDGYTCFGHIDLPDEWAGPEWRLHLEQRLVIVLHTNDRLEHRPGEVIAGRGFIEPGIEDRQTRYAYPHKLVSSGVRSGPERLPLSAQGRPGR